MDKVKEIEASFNHGLSLAERKNVVVTGVKKIESFDSNEFMIDTTLGFLNIKGEELEIIKLDGREEALVATHPSGIDVSSKYILIEPDGVSALKLFLL